MILERDHAAPVERKVRAILGYLDFKLVEEACARGVLAAARRENNGLALMDWNRLIPFVPT